MVAPCIIIIKHYIVQLMHRNYKILRLLKKVKIIKAAPYAAITLSTSITTRTLVPAMKFS